MRIGEQRTPQRMADPARLYPTVDELKRLQDLGARHGIAIDMVDSVLLRSSHIDSEKESFHHVDGQPTARSRHRGISNADSKLCGSGHAKPNDFAETFPDDGDVDMVRALRVYKEVGYDGMLMPDHVPHVPERPEATRENFASAYGYIRGLLQAVDA